MALSVIIVLYVCVGILAAAGSIFIAQQLFSAKAEQIFFALFLVAIAAFYLAFTAYFGDQRAWRLETVAVIVFLTLLLPQLASAKRLPSVKVDPVLYEVSHYVAPNDDGRRGYIEA